MGMSGVFQEQFRIALNAKTEILEEITHLHLHTELPLQMSVKRMRTTVSKELVLEKTLLRPLEDVEDSESRSRKEQRGSQKPLGDDPGLSRSFSVELQSSLSGKTPLMTSNIPPPPPPSTASSPTDTLEVAEASTVAYTVPYGEGSAGSFNFITSPTVEEASMTAAFREESDEVTESPQAAPERRQDVAPNLIRPSDTSKSKNPSRNPTIEILTGLIQLLGGDVRRRATPPPTPPPPQVMHPNFNFHPPQNALMGPPHPPPQFLHPLPPHQHRRPPFEIAQQFPNKPNIPAYIPSLNPSIGPHLPPQQPPGFYYPSPSDVSNILGVDEATERPVQRFELKTPDLAPTVTVPVEIDDETLPVRGSSSRNTIVFIHEAPPSLLPSATMNPSAAPTTTATKTLPDEAYGNIQSEKGTPVIEVVEPVATQRPSIQTNRPSNIWLPVGADDTSRVNIKYDPHNEPDIITQVAEPSIFDVTVVGDLNPTISNTKDLGPPPEIITETFTNVKPTPSQAIMATPTTDLASTTTITYSEPSSEAFPVFLPTPTISPTSSSDVVVYGKSSSGDTRVNSTTASSSSEKPNPTSTSSTPALLTKTHGIGKPYVVPVDVDPVRPSVQQSGFGHIKQASRNATPLPNIKQKAKRPTFKTKTNATLVRIDTCIVGDDSTCDANVNEWCKTDQGISTCTCRPGYARTQPRGPCLATISMQLTFKLDRMGEKKLHYNTNYLNPDSEEYQVLAFETRQALRSLFAKSTFSRVFMDSKVNGFKGSGSKVLVNATVEFEENDITRVSSVKRVVQHEMVNLISRGKSNLGDSRLFVEPLLNSALTVEDVNECRDVELHDCSPHASCENSFGNFKCVCKPGYTDKNPDTRRAGRVCAGCGPDFCNNRGECSIVDGERSCACKGKFMGPRCDIDGEVLAVALGASVTAVVIIILTLVCLCLWNRRWKREQAKAEVMSVASMAGYLNKTNSIGYRMHQSAAQDDRFRWSSHLDSLPNIYVQPDSSPLHSMPRAQSIYATQRHMRSHSPAMELENPYGHLPARPKSRGAMTHFGPASLASPYEFDPNKQASLFGSYRNPGTTRSMRPVFNAHW
ncbi:uncharacterized protein LOC108864160 [Galendromus occidentalis]|uniref:Uncharacterized protein LOC108864160 n=1 Tax=Galendromus occidentalis TaxID=34638 RepID=A0AAJ7L554_9ACAR|nr:uncharacterized protein LOC108864160 [Galendromus occidentalis]